MAAFFTAEDAEHAEKKRGNPHGLLSGLYVLGGEF
jgi:hypothetical protein